MALGHWWSDRMVDAYSDSSTPVRCTEFGFAQAVARARAAKRQVRQRIRFDARSEFDPTFRIFTVDDTPPCEIRGPYLPVGDVEWVCHTHGDVVCEYDGPEIASGESPRREDFRCPVSSPRPYDHPLEYESRNA